jgi:kynureninase
VDFDHALEASRELNSRDVVVDYRPGAGIRMSPHFYTADGELDRAFEAIDEIRASGAWKRWRGEPAIVT